MTYFNDATSGTVRQGEPLVSRAARDCRKNLQKIVNVLDPKNRKLRFGTIPGQHEWTRKAPPATRDDWQLVADNLWAVSEAALAARCVALSCRNEATS